MFLTKAVCFRRRAVTPTLTLVRRRSDHDQMNPLGILRPDRILMSTQLRRRRGDQLHQICAVALIRKLRDLNHEEDRKCHFAHKPPGRT